MLPMGLNAQKVINQSNDKTFNVIVDYQRYNDDKYSIVVKNGGIVTDQSISKPVYKLVTNIDVHDDEPAHVIEFDSLKKAFEYIDQHNELEKLDDNSQSYFKPIIKKMLGDSVFITNHTNTALLQNVRDAANNVVENKSVAASISEDLDRIRKLTKNVRNTVDYNWGIQQLDKLFAKCRKLPNNRSIIDALNLYNNFVCR